MRRRSARARPPAGRRRLSPVPLQPVKILFVLANVEWGGVKTWALDTAVVLSRRGHRCMMIGRCGNPSVQACHAARVPTHGLIFGPFGTPLVGVQGAVRARQTAVDVLIV